jgi:hypothetical protein
MIDRRAFLKGVLATTPLVLAAPALLRAQPAQAKGIGPSTTTEPYLLPSIPGVATISILTVGDAIGGHRMVGIPDGLGALRHGHDVTLLMNHEITAARPGIVRAHGSNGAFVSRWTIDRRTLEVRTLEDHTQSPSDVHLWDSPSHQYVRGTTQWQRLCSADLAAESAFSGHGLGIDDRLFLDGEEVTEGRAWARVASGPHIGEAWQLPRLGRLSFENAVASPYAGDKTVVVCLDDGALSTAPVAGNFPSEVYVYVGDKTRRGELIDRAGLTSGNLYGLRISVGNRQVSEESDPFGLGDATTGFVARGRFGLANLGDVSDLSALQLEQASINAGVTRFQRCEDGAWDPRKRRRNDFYFVTTGSLTNNSRLWRLRFDDVERPERGGSIEILLRGTEGHTMLDNVTIDRQGRVLMDEDPGNAPRVSKIWLYDIASGQFVQVAAHNPKFFDPTIPANPDFITQDEESSGIIDAGHLLGKGWFLLDVQSHKLSSDPELVEGGQLLAMFVDPDIGHPGHDDDEEYEDDPT